MAIRANAKRNLNIHWRRAGVQILFVGAVLRKLIYPVRTPAIPYWSTLGEARSQNAQKWGKLMRMGLK